MTDLKNVPPELKKRYPDSTFELMENGNYAVANSSYFAIVDLDGNSLEFHAI